MFRVRRAKRRRSSDMASSQVNVLGQQRDVDMVARIHRVREREVEADAAQGQLLHTLLQHATRLCGWRASST